MNKIELRPARASDVATILRFSAALYKEDGLLPLDEESATLALRQLLGNPSYGEVWLAERGGAACAYLILTFGFSLEYKGRNAFVDEIYVTPAQRRKGIARALLRKAEEICQVRGVKALHLEVERKNTTAQILYRNAGFENNDRHLITKWLQK